MRKDRIADLLLATESVSSVMPTESISFLMKHCGDIRRKLAGVNVQNSALLGICPAKWPYDAEIEASNITKNDPLLLVFEHGYP